MDIPTAAEAAPCNRPWDKVAKAINQKVLKFTIYALRLIHQVKKPTD